MVMPTTTCDSGASNVPKYCASYTDESLKVFSDEAQANETKQEEMATMFNQLIEKATDKCYVEGDKSVMGRCTKEDKKSVSRLRYFDGTSCSNSTRNMTMPSEFA